MRMLPATYLKRTWLKHMGVDDHFDCHQGLQRHPQSKPCLQTLRAPRAQKHTVSKAKEQKGHVNARRGYGGRGQMRTVEPTRDSGVSSRLTLRTALARGPEVRICANLAGAAFQVCDDAHSVPGQSTQVDGRSSTSPALDAGSTRSAPDGGRQRNASCDQSVLATLEEIR